jgi:hypothetical protein
MDLLGQSFSIFSHIHDPQTIRKHQRGTAPHPKPANNCPFNWTNPLQPPTACAGTAAPPDCNTTEALCGDSAVCRFLLSTKPFRTAKGERKEPCCVQEQAAISERRRVVPFGKLVLARAPLLEQAVHDGLRADEQHAVKLMLETPCSARGRARWLFVAAAA